MALPALGVIFGGSIIAGLVQFFTTKAGTILAGLGLTFIFAKGFQYILSYAIADIVTVMSALQSQAGALSGGMGLGAVALQFAAYVGFFDGINIVIAGMFTSMSLYEIRVLLGRLK